MVIETAYRIALDALERQIPDALQAKFAIHKTKLLENLDDEQLFGRTATSQNDRIRVVAALNQLAKDAGLETNFTELWQAASQYGYIPPKTPPAAPEPPAPAQTCIDVEIHIGAQQAEGYPVSITLDGEQHFSGGYLSADIADWQSGADLAASGQELFAALFGASAIRDAWSEARGQARSQTLARRVRLHIDARAPELHVVPWEMLHEGDVMLAANAGTPFSRYLPVTEPWGAAVRARPLRVLAVISNPADLREQGLSPLTVADEQSILQNAFSKLSRDDAQVDFLPEPATLEALGEALREGYHVLHYVGHGKFGRMQQAMLLLQGADGNAEAVSDAALSAMLARQGVKPRLVFLAACQSATRSRTDAFLGLAPRLVRAGIPAVVAMQDFVEINTARKVTEVFYKQAAQHGEVDRALNAARDALLNAEMAGAAVPVLFMRLKDGQMWTG